MIGCGLRADARALGAPAIWNLPERCSDAEKRQLGCFLDAAGPNTGSADTDLHAHAVNYRANTLEIRIPAAAPGIIRVADHVPERRPLATNFTFLSHSNSPTHFHELTQSSKLIRVLATPHQFDSDAEAAPS